MEAPPDAGPILLLFMSFSSLKSSLSSTLPLSAALDFKFIYFCLQIEKSDLSQKDDSFVPSTLSLAFPVSLPLALALGSSLTTLPAFPAPIPCHPS